MLEHLSPKFKMPPMEREPRAALILNRFTRNLTIMYATDVVTQILGLRPDELVDRPFYDCIQSNCIDEAERCLESAKANESIAYLRFWYRDPRTDPSDSGIGEEDEEPGEAEDTDDEADWRSRSSGGSEPDMKEPREPHSKDSCMEIDRRPDTQTQKAKGNDNGRENGEDDAPLRGGAQSPRQSTRRPPAPQTFELEAVVSCTSDGLVVVLRRARPPIPSPQPPVPPAAFNFENGLFAAPWGRQPIEPYISPDLLYTFRAPLLPQYMPLRDCIKAAGGPPMDRTYKKTLVRQRDIRRENDELIQRDRSDAFNTRCSCVCLGCDRYQREPRDLRPRPTQARCTTRRQTSRLGARLRPRTVSAPRESSSEPERRGTRGALGRRAAVRPRHLPERRATGPRLCSHAARLAGSEHVREPSAADVGTDDADSAVPPRRRIR